MHSEYSAFRGRGSLKAVVDELQRQVDSRVDFVADNRDMVLIPDFDKAPGTMILKPKADSLRDFLPETGVHVLPQALMQLGSKAGPGIGARELKKLAEANPRRTADFLTGLMHDDPKRRLVRCLDGSCRAFLSDRYRVIDNLDLAKWSLGALKESGNGSVLEASLTDRHLRIKMVATEVWDAVERTRTADPSAKWYAGGLGNQEYLSKVAARSTGDLPMQGGPDTCWPIVTVYNSETGHGGYGASIGILMAICFNLATVEERMANVHLGARLETGIYSRETVQAEAHSIMLKLRDTIRAGFDQQHFRALVDQIRDAAGKVIRAPQMACQNLVKASDAIGEQDLDGILAHFLREPGEPSVFNLGQAVARFAQDTEDADKADGLEALAGAILKGELTPALGKAL